MRGTDILRRIDALASTVWRCCRACGALLDTHRQDHRHGVCPECGDIRRLSALERIDQLTDPGSFVQREAGLLPDDPFDFTDRLPYRDRVRAAQAETGLSEAALVGTASIDGHPVAFAVLDFSFLGGSMGSVVGEKVARIVEHAADHRLPLVAVASSGGARMQEGALSLFQMAKTAAAVRRLRAAAVPYLCVLTDPVYGGVAASFAGLGDITIAEAGTRAGFAGPDVVRQTIGERLPPGFQTAEFLRAHGHLDQVVSRAQLRRLLARILAVWAAPKVLAPAGPPPHDGSAQREVDAWDAVRMARTAGRPTAREYAELLFTGFLELHGDRWSGDDPAVLGGLGWLGALPVMVVGTCKGRDTAENVRRNFGMPHPNGYRKAMRLFTLAERLGVPVVTLIDTPGAYPGLRAEEGNQSGAIAEALAMISALRVPVVSLVTGEGGSGGALALAAGDRLLMQENAILSVISPEGCATILFGDAARAPQAARALRLQAGELCRLGIADALVPEPPGGSQADPAAAARLLAGALRHHLGELLDVPADELVAGRYRRLRGIGSMRDEAGRTLEVARV
jgi:acyl-CoA carboxylase subunit beta